MTDIPNLYERILRRNVLPEWLAASLDLAYQRCCNCEACGLGICIYHERMFFDSQDHVSGQIYLCGLRERDCSCLPG